MARLNPIHLKCLELHGTVEHPHAPQYSLSYSSGVNAVVTFIPSTKDCLTLEDILALSVALPDAEKALSRDNLAETMVHIFTKSGEVYARELAERGDEQLALREKVRYLELFSGA